MPTGLSIRGGASFKSLSRTLQKRALKLAPAQARAMATVIYTMEADLKRNTLSAKGGSSAFWGKTGAQGDALAVVTGHTRRSIVARVFSKLTTIVGVIGSPLVSFAAHEWGAVIHGHPYLRIPTAWAKTAAGADRLAGRSARTLPGTAVFRSRAGNLFVWGRTPTGTVPLYLLKPSVTLRARHMLGNLLKRSRTLIRTTLVGSTSRVIKGY